MKQLRPSLNWILLCTISVINRAVSDDVVQTPRMTSTTPWCHMQYTPALQNQVQNQRPIEISCISSDLNIFNIIKETRDYCRGRDYIVTFYLRRDGKYTNLGSLAVDNYLFHNALMKYSSWLLSGEKFDSNDKKESEYADDVTKNQQLRDSSKTRTGVLSWSDPGRQKTKYSGPLAPEYICDCVNHQDVDNHNKNRVISKKDFKVSNKENTYEKLKPKYNAKLHGYEVFLAEDNSETTPATNQNVKYIISDEGAIKKVTTDPIVVRTFETNVNDMNEQIDDLNIEKEIEVLPASNNMSDLKTEVIDLLLNDDVGQFYFEYNKPGTDSSNDFDTIDSDLVNTCSTGDPEEYQKGIDSYLQDIENDTTDFDSPVIQYKPFTIDYDDDNEVNVYQGDFDDFDDYSKDSFDFDQVKYYDFNSLDPTSDYSLDPSVLNSLPLAPVSRKIPSQYVLPSSQDARQFSNTGYFGAPTYNFEQSPQKTPKKKPSQTLNVIQSPPVSITSPISPCKNNYIPPDSRASQSFTSPVGAHTPAPMKTIPLIRNGAPIYTSSNSPIKSDITPPSSYSSIPSEQIIEPAFLATPITSYPSRERPFINISPYSPSLKTTPLVEPSNIEPYIQPIRTTSPTFQSSVKRPSVPPSYSNRLPITSQPSISNISPSIYTFPQTISPTDSPFAKPSIETDLSKILSNKNLPTIVSYAENTIPLSTAKTPPYWQSSFIPAVGISPSLTPSKSSGISIPIRSNLPSTTSQSSGYTAQPLYVEDATPISPINKVVAETIPIIVDFPVSLSEVTHELPIIIEPNKPANINLKASEYSVPSSYMNPNIYSNKPQFSYYPSEDTASPIQANEPKYKSLSSPDFSFLQDPFKKQAHNWLSPILNTPMHRAIPSSSVPELFVSPLQKTPEIKTKEATMPTRGGRVPAGIYSQYTALPEISSLIPKEPLMVYPLPVNTEVCTNLEHLPNVAESSLFTIPIPSYGTSKPSIQSLSINQKPTTTGTTPLSFSPILDISATPSVTPTLLPNYQNLLPIDSVTTGRPQVSGFKPWTQNHMPFNTPATSIVASHSPMPTSPYVSQESVPKAASLPIQYLSSRPYQTTVYPRHVPLCIPVSPDWRIPHQTLPIRSPLPVTPISISQSDVRSPSKHLNNQWHSPKLTTPLDIIESPITNYYTPSVPTSQSQSSSDFTRTAPKETYSNAKPIIPLNTLSKYQPHPVVHPISYEEMPSRLVPYSPTKSYIKPNFNNEFISYAPVSSTPKLSSAFPFLRQEYLPSTPIESKGTPLLPIAPMASLLPYEVKSITSLDIPAPLSSLYTSPYTAKGVSTSPVAYSSPWMNKDFFKTTPATFTPTTYQATPVIPPYTGPVVSSNFLPLSSIASAVYAPLSESPSSLIYQPTFPCSSKNKGSSQALYPVSTSTSPSYSKPLTTIPSGPVSSYLRPKQKAITVLPESTSAYVTPLINNAQAVPSSIFLEPFKPYISPLQKQPIFASSSPTLSDSKTWQEKYINKLKSTPVMMPMFEPTPLTIPISPTPIHVEPTSISNSLKSAPIYSIQPTYIGPSYAEDIVPKPASNMPIAPTMPYTSNPPIYLPTPAAALPILPTAYASPYLPVKATMPCALSPIITSSSLPIPSYSFQPHPPTSHISPKKQKICQQLSPASIPITPTASYATPLLKSPFAELISPVSFLDPLLTPLTSPLISKNIPRASSDSSPRFAAPTAANIPYICPKSELPKPTSSYMSAVPPLRSISVTPSIGEPRSLITPLLSKGMLQPITPSTLDYTSPSSDSNIAQLNTLPNILPSKTYSPVQNQYIPESIKSRPFEFAQYSPETLTELPIKLLPSSIYKPLPSPIATSYPATQVSSVYPDLSPSLKRIPNLNKYISPIKIPAIKYGTPTVLSSGSISDISPIEIPASTYSTPKIISPDSLPFASKPFISPLTAPMSSIPTLFSGFQPSENYNLASQLPIPAFSKPKPMKFMGLMPDPTITQNIPAEFSSPNSNNLASQLPIPAFSKPKPMKFMGLVPDPTITQNIPAEFSSPNSNNLASQLPIPAFSKPKPMKFMGLVPDPTITQNIPAKFSSPNSNSLASQLPIPAFSKPKPMKFMGLVPDPTITQNIPAKFSSPNSNNLASQLPIPAFSKPKPMKFMGLVPDPTITQNIPAKFSCSNSNNLASQLPIPAFSKPKPMKFMGLVPDPTITQNIPAKFSSSNSNVPFIPYSQYSPSTSYSYSPNVRPLKQIPLESASAGVPMQYIPQYVSPLQPHTVPTSSSNSYLPLRISKPLLNSNYLPQALKFTPNMAQYSPLSMPWSPTLTANPSQIGRPSIKTPSLSNVQMTSSPNYMTPIVPETSFLDKVIPVFNEYISEVTPIPSKSAPFIPLTIEKHAPSIAEPYQWPSLPKTTPFTPKITYTEPLASIYSSPIAQPIKKDSVSPFISHYDILPSNVPITPPLMADKSPLVTSMVPSIFGYQGKPLLQPSKKSYDAPSLSPVYYPTYKLRNLTPSPIISPLQSVPLSPLSPIISPLQSPPSYSTTTPTTVISEHKLPIIPISPFSPILPLTLPTKPLSQYIASPWFSPVSPVKPMSSSQTNPHLTQISPITSTPTSPPIPLQTIAEAVPVSSPKLSQYIPCISPISNPQFTTPISMSPSPSQSFTQPLSSKYTIPSITQNSERIYPPYTPAFYSQYASPATIPTITKSPIIKLTASKIPTNIDAISNIAPLYALPITAAELLPSSLTKPLFAPPLSSLQPLTVKSLPISSVATPAPIISALQPPEAVKLPLTPPILPLSPLKLELQSSSKFSPTPITSPLQPPEAANIPLIPLKSPIKSLPGTPVLSPSSIPPVTRPLSMYTPNLASYIPQPLVRPISPISAVSPAIPCLTGATGETQALKALPSGSILKTFTTPLVTPLEASQPGTPLGTSTIPSVSPYLRQYISPYQPAEPISISPIVTSKSFISLSPLTPVPIRPLLDPKRFTTPMQLSTPYTPMVSSQPLSLTSPLIRISPNLQYSSTKLPSSKSQVPISPTTTISNQYVEPASYTVPDTIMNNILQKRPIAQSASSIPITPFYTSSILSKPTAQLSLPTLDLSLYSPISSSTFTQPRVAKPIKPLYSQIVSPISLPKSTPQFSQPSEYITPLSASELIPTRPILPCSVNLASSPAILPATLLKDTRPFMTPAKYYTPTSSSYSSPYTSPLKYLKSSSKIAPQLPSVTPISPTTPTASPVSFTPLSINDNPAPSTIIPNLPTTIIPTPIKYLTPTKPSFTTRYPSPITQVNSIEMPQYSPFSYTKTPPGYSASLPTIDSSIYYMPASHTAERPTSAKYITPLFTPKLSTASISTPCSSISSKPAVPIIPLKTYYPSHVNQAVSPIETPQYSPFSFTKSMPYYSPLLSSIDSTVSSITPIAKPFYTPQHPPTTPAKYITPLFTPKLSTAEDMPSPFVPITPSSIEVSSPILPLESKNKYLTYPITSTSTLSPLKETLIQTPSKPMWQYSPLPFLKPVPYTQKPLLSSNPISNIQFMNPKSLFSSPLDTKIPFTTQYPTPMHTVTSVTPPQFSPFDSYYSNVPTPMHFSTTPCLKTPPNAYLSPPYTSFTPKITPLITPFTGYKSIQPLLTPLPSSGYPSRSPITTPVKDVTPLFTSLYPARPQNTFYPITKLFESPKTSEKYFDIPQNTLKTSPMSSEYLTPSSPTTMPYYSPPFNPLSNPLSTSVSYIKTPLRPLNSLTSPQRSDPIYTTPLSLNDNPITSTIIPNIPTITPVQRLYTPVTPLPITKPSFTIKYSPSNIVSPEVIPEVSPLPSKYMTSHPLPAPRLQPTPSYEQNAVLPISVLPSSSNLINGIPSTPINPCKSIIPTRSTSSSVFYPSTSNTICSPIITPQFSPFTIAENVRPHSPLLTPVHNIGSAFPPTYSEVLPISNRPILGTPLNSNIMQSSYLAPSNSMFYSSPASNVFYPSTSPKFSPYTTVKYTPLTSLNVSPTSIPTIAQQLKYNPYLSSASLPNRLIYSAPSSTNTYTSATPKHQTSLKQYSNYLSPSEYSPITQPNSSSPIITKPCQYAQYSKPLTTVYSPMAAQELPYTSADYITTQPLIKTTPSKYTNIYPLPSITVVPSIAEYIRTQSPVSKYLSIVPASPYYTTQNPTPISLNSPKGMPGFAPFPYAEYAPSTLQSYGVPASPVTSSHIQNIPYTSQSLPIYSRIPTNMSPLPNVFNSNVPLSPTRIGSSFNTCFPVPFTNSHFVSPLYIPQPTLMGLQNPYIYNQQPINLGQHYYNHFNNMNICKSTTKPLDFRQAIPSTYYNDPNKSPILPTYPIQFSVTPSYSNISPISLTPHVDFLNDANFKTYPIKFNYQPCYLQTDQNALADIIKNPIENAIKTNIFNYIKNNEELKARLLNSDTAVSIPIGNIILAKKDCVNPTIQAINPSIGVKVWPSHVKLVEAKLELKFKDAPVTNFQPVVHNINKYDVEEIEKLVKNYIRNKYGDVIVVHDSYSLNNEYEVIKNCNNVICDKYNLLWPAEHQNQIVNALKVHNCNRIS